MSTKVKVVNPVWNGNGRIKRKVADCYANEGRAEWVGQDQIRLVLTHPKNQAAAARARAWEAECAPNSEGGIAHALTLFGSGGLAARDHLETRFERPRKSPDRIGPVRQARPSAGQPTIGRYSSIMAKFRLIRHVE